MFNIASYIIYFAIAIPVTVFVGWKCYTVGKIYLLDLMKDEIVCNAVNRLLLAGYYLLNIGYIAISVSGWGTIATYTEIFQIVFSKIAVILLIISILHYANIALLYFFRNQIILTFKNL